MSRRVRRSCRMAVVTAAVASLGLVAASCAGHRKACIALAVRIDEPPRPLADDARRPPPEWRVLATSADFEEAGEARDIARPPDRLILLAPRDLTPEDEKRWMEERVPYGRYEYRVEALDVVEDSPALADLPVGDPAALPGNAEWSHQLINYDAALAALDDERVRTHRPRLAEAPAGSGVVIGHPDTGHTFHHALGRFRFGPAFSDAPPTPLRPREGYGFRDCNCNTFDLELSGLTAGLRDPGHGTSTSSVIVGPYARSDDNPRSLKMRGIAPGARLIPLRTATGVIIGEARAFQLAMAVHHASHPAPAAAEEAEAEWADQCIRQRETCRRGEIGGGSCSLTMEAAHVISISMGGPPKLIRRAMDDLANAVRGAERNGVIVVAAAGQTSDNVAAKAIVKALHGSGVVYPAAFDGTIAAAACNIRGRPWAASFRGTEVDITAPGEGVWTAKFRRSGDSAEPIVAPGKGTSFATAIVAGVAALWLDYHGRDALVAKYGTPAVLPSAFKWVLVNHGFNTPDELCTLARGQGLAYAGALCDASAEGWDTRRFGPGVLDVRKVLTTPLPDKDQLCRFVRGGIGPDGRWRRTPADAAFICPAP